MKTIIAHMLKAAFVTLTFWFVFLDLIAAAQYIKQFNADARLAEKITVAQQNHAALYHPTATERLNEKVAVAIANVKAMEGKI